jgi:hypothetical protein
MPERSFANSFCNSLNDDYTRAALVHSLARLQNIRVRRFSDVFQANT